MASFHISVKTGKRGNAAEHAAYIARAGKHLKKGEKTDLVAVEHGNLPEWANGSTQEFWKAADKYERLNGATYRELEVALPNELSNEQNLALVKDFVKSEIGDKPFQYAIHLPNAAVGNVDQPHAHIMLSDRMHDGIMRTPAKHFQRHNTKIPGLGGCKKDSGGRDPKTLKTEIIRLREHWAELQNEHLAKNVHVARVDHRSNMARGLDAEPERHLGQVGVKMLTDDAKEALREKRESIKKPPSYVKKVVLPTVA